MSEVILRVLGVLVGLIFVATSSLMLFLEQDGTLSQISGLVLGALFCIYGVLGRHKLSKILPSITRNIGNDAST
jgi:hypothetical protein